MKHGAYEILKKYIKEHIENILSEETTPEMTPFIILQKFPSVEKVIRDLMGKTYSNYVQEVFVIAPKPTTFRVNLKNGQFFYLEYSGKDKSGAKYFVAKVEGKKYNLADIYDEQSAIRGIQRLLMLGKLEETPSPTETEKEPKAEKPAPKTPAETPTETPEQ